MRKVLIVDDEKYIQLGIKSIIEMSNSTFDEIYITSNGHEALELLLKYQFDLVISDIKMPIMDGIQLMKSIHQKEIHTRFIILSGYDEFKYAKEALNFGAKAYLLKPIQKDELIEIILKMESEIIVEEEKNNLENKVTSFLSKFKTHELSFLLENDTINNTETLNILNTLGLDFLIHECIIAFISPKTLIPDYKLDYSLIELAIDKYLKHYDISNTFFLHMDNNLVMISSDQIDLNDMLNFLSNEFNCKFISGISIKNPGETNLKKSYYQAMEASKYSLIFDEKTIINSDEIKEKLDNFAIPIIQINTLASKLNTSKPTDLDDLIDQIFDSEIILKCNINYIHKVINYIEQFVIEVISAHFPYKSDIKLKWKNVLLENYSKYSIWLFIAEFKKFLHEINEFILTLKDSSDFSSEMDKAFKYIHGNYSKNISMESVSSHVGLSYTYFSHLFNEKTKVSFSDFLKKIRMEKAAELLKQTDDKISDIALAVGYYNTKHFRNSFKNIYGISPTEYREKLF